MTLLSSSEDPLLVSLLILLYVEDMIITGEDSAGIRSLQLFLVSILR